MAEIPVIQVEDLRKHYGAVRAVDGISFTVARCAPGARATGAARPGVRLDIDAFFQRSYGSLSAGQKTRVALAKALVNEPDILLLERDFMSHLGLEPLSGWLGNHPP